ncbi:MAG: hypothetical protein V1850_04000 [Candidatus Bathyarchaeota archaeon]
MQPEKLSEKASRIAQEAKKLLEAINRFGPGSERMVHEAVRRSAINEVDQVFQKVVEEVNAEEANIKLLPELNRGKEVRVQASYSPFSQTYLFSAAKINPEPFHFTLLKGLEKDTIYSSIEVFKNLIQELKTSILEGKLDKNIYMTAEELIYRKICEANRENDSGSRS